MKRRDEDGNVLIIILVAIMLIGLLTAVIQGSSNNDNANIDKEQLLLNASRVRQYAMELENAVSIIVRNGHSEVDIRFANPDSTITDYGDMSADTEKTRQVFHADGGAAEYRSAPVGIQTSASSWEFYGGTSLPGVGTSAPDLIAVLPNVTLAFCQKVNEMNGYAKGTSPPTDTGSCLNAGAAERFGTGVTFDGTANDATGEATFTVLPAMQGCARCDDATYNFFHVLLKR